MHVFNRINSLLCHCGPLHLISNHFLVFVTEINAFILQSADHEQFDVLARNQVIWMTSITNTSFDYTEKDMVASLSVIYDIELIVVMVERSLLTW